MNDVEIKIDSLIKRIEDDGKQLKSLYFHTLDIKSIQETASAGMIQLFKSFTPSRHSAISKILSSYSVTIQSEYESSMKKLNVFNRDCITPLLKYIEHYDKVSVEGIEYMHKIMKEYKYKYSDTAANKEKYKMSCVKYQSFLSLHQAVESKKSSTLLIKLEQESFANEVEYKHKIEEYNLFIQSKKTVFIETYKSLYDLDVERNKFIEENLSKIIILFKQLYSQFSHTLELLLPQCKINDTPKDNAKEYISVTEAFREETFAPIQKFDKEAKRMSLPSPVIEYSPVKARPPINSGCDEFLQLMGTLLKADPIPLDDKTKIFDYLQYPWAEEAIISNLQSISQTKRLIALDNMRFLGQILNYLLVLEEQRKKQNLILISSVLSCCLRVHAYSNNVRVPLSSILSAHSIWKAEHLWIQIIDHVIDEKYSESSNKRNSLPESKIKKFTGLITKIFYFDKKEAYSKNSVYFIVSQFISLMSNMKVQRTFSTAIVLNYSNKHQFDKEKIITLLSELESSQPIEKRPISIKDVRTQSLLRREKERKGYGYDRKVFAIGLSMQYISDLTTFYSLISVSKNWKDIFSRHAYKMMLLSNIPTPQKLLIWRKYLEVNMIHLDYQHLKAKASILKEIKKNIDDLILMDVSRSFQNCKYISQEALISILRTYCLLNSELEYCQGMNYLVGFLLLVFKEEEIAFKALIGIIEKMRMTSLLSNGMRTLKLYVYQLQRMTAIYIPDLHQHFIEESISPELYASPWVLTVFTNITQYSKQSDPPKLLIAIWDHFFVYGWKGILMSILFILSTFKTKLLGMSFDETVKFMGDGVKSLFYSDDDSYNQYMRFMSQNKIPKDLLTSLEIEFKRIAEIANKNMMIGFKKDSKHTVKIEGVEQIIDLL